MPDDPKKERRPRGLRPIGKTTTSTGPLAVYYGQVRRALWDAGIRVFAGKVVVTESTRSA